VTSPSTLEQVDLLLAAWDERLRRIDENLVALESEAIYQVLAGKAGKRAALEGATREAVYPALDAVTEMFENRDRLAAVVAQAREVRATIGALTLWNRDEKIAEVVRLLRGRSIELAHRVVALGERSLLDQGYEDVLVDPEQLCAAMVKSFEASRTTLLSVSRAWESLDPAMAEIEREMTRLRALVAEIHLEKQPARELSELAAAEAELAALRARVAKDPLGAQGGVQKRIAPLLAALRARVDAEVASKARAKAGMEEARDLRRRMAETHARAARAREEARREIEGPSLAAAPPPVDDGELDGLDLWLKKLEVTLEGRRWAPAEVGLTRWRETAGQYLATDERAAASAEALLALRGELGGRLSARRAQAAALGARGLALPAAAEARARDADQLLRRRPAPIDEARRAVEEYEALVVGLAARRGA
jgi:hypothetical protein